MEKQKTKEMSEEDFKALAQPSFELEETKEKDKQQLVEAYRNLVDILKEWCDLREDYYRIVALWIIGTYFHDSFPTYPYLFFNAMKGSGKSRLLKLVTYLSKDGALLNSLTEAELFRSMGTLGIDEFEGVSRKGFEALRELLNSGYKKGTKVRRMRKAKTMDGERQVVEEFEVYRPICMANINGMDDVLGDRCISLILEKSFKTQITNLVEIFEDDDLIQKTKELLTSFIPNKENKCRVCNVGLLKNIYMGWNIYVKGNYTLYTLHTHNTLYTSYTQLYESIKFAGIGGRELELSLPLFILSDQIGEIEPTLCTIQKIMKEKRTENVIENRDISLYDFLSQEAEVEHFLSVNELTKKFKEFLQTNDDSINSTWVGLALKRLNLIIEKRRIARGVEVRLNFVKAKEKMRMFK